MPDTVDKISLLNAIPVRSEQVKTEWKGEYVVLAFPRFKKEWMRRFWLFKGLSQDIHVTFGRAWDSRLAINKRPAYRK